MKYKKPGPIKLVQNCTFSQVGVNHTPETRLAIESIASAVRAQAVANEKTAEALAALAKSVGGSEAKFAPMVHI